jgi:LAO/AO transport system kinase
VLRTVAKTGEGVDELFDAIVQHRAQLEASGEAVTRRRSRLRDELRGLVAARIEQQVDALCSGKQFDALVDQVMDRATDPYTAADALVQ